MVAMSIRRQLVALAVLAVVAAACSSSSPPGAEGGSPVRAAPATNAATAALLPTNVLALPSFDFGRFEELLGQLRGTPVLVNIWASWCGPCRTEAPHLADAARRFGSKVQFLGVDILDSRPSARSFMQQEGWTYPSVYDETGAIRDRLGFIGQPVTAFFDASGTLVSSWSGPVTPEILTQRLQGLLGQGPTA
jgi:thiol-disulfide isomerase/thioredoxin